MLGDWWLWGHGAALPRSRFSSLKDLKSAYSLSYWSQTELIISQLEFVK